MITEANKALLYCELDEWNYIGEEALFWWRDDDAQTESDQLDRLITLCDRYSVPLAMAVIPDGSTDALKHRIADKDVRVLQHGYAHKNHADAGKKKQELGNRELDVMRAELAEGFSTLSDRFGEQFDAVLVPPWNRVDARLFPFLTAIGLLGVSTYGPRKEAQLASDLHVVNVHVDIINWKEQKRFLGEELIINHIVRHLSAKRLGQIDALEPTGIMTHHLAHDDECWQFLDGLFQAMDDHPAVKWLDATRVFALRWR